MMMMNGGLHHALSHGQKIFFFFKQKRINGRRARSFVAKFAPNILSTQSNWATTVGSITFKTVDQDVTRKDPTRNAAMVRKVWNYENWNARVTIDIVTHIKAFWTDGCLCDECGRLFTRKKNLFAHKRLLHAGRKTWICAKCPFKTIFPRNLQRH